MFAADTASLAGSASSEVTCPPRSRTAAPSQIVEYPREPPISSTSQPGLPRAEREQERAARRGDLKRTLAVRESCGLVALGLLLEPPQNGAHPVVEHQRPRSRSTSSRTQQLGEVVVHDAACLHRGVHRRRANEPEALPAEALGERRRLGRCRGPVLRRGGRPGRRRRMRPDELVQRLAGLAQRDRGAGVRDRRLDLAAVADDPRVTEQPLDVGLAERRHPIDLEPGERRPEASRLRRIVSQESPDWKPSRQSRS